MIDEKLPILNMSLLKPINMTIGSLSIYHSYLKEHKEPQNFGSVYDISTWVHFNLVYNYTIEIVFLYAIVSK